MNAFLALFLTFLPAIAVLVIGEALADSRGNEGWLVAGGLLFVAVLTIGGLI